MSSAISRSSASRWVSSSRKSSRAWTATGTSATPPTSAPRPPGSGVGAASPARAPPHGTPILRGRFHHDFLDVLLDQPVRQRSQLTGAGAHLPAVKLPRASTSTSATTTANIFLCTSMPAIQYAIRASRHGAERVPTLSYSGSRLSRRPAGRQTTPNHFAQVRTRRISQFIGLNGPTATLDLTAPRRPILPNAEIVITFRGLKAHSANSETGQ